MKSSSIEVEVATDGPLSWADDVQQLGDVLLGSWVNGPSSPVASCISLATAEIHPLLGLLYCGSNISFLFHIFWYYRPEDLESLCGGVGGWREVWVCVHVCKFSHQVSMKSGLCNFPAPFCAYTMVIIETPGCVDLQHCIFPSLPAVPTPDWLNQVRVETKRWKTLNIVGYEDKDLEPLTRLWTGTEVSLKLAHTQDTAVHLTEFSLWQSTSMLIPKIFWALSWLLNVLKQKLSFSLTPLGLKKKKK